MHAGVEEGFLPQAGMEHVKVVLRGFVSELYLPDLHATLVVKLRTVKAHLVTGES